MEEDRCGTYIQVFASGLCNLWLCSPYSSGISRASRGLPRRTGTYGFYWLHEDQRNFSLLFLLLCSCSFFLLFSGMAELDYSCSDHRRSYSHDFCDVHQYAFRELCAYQTTGLCASLQGSTHPMGAKCAIDHGD